MWDLWYRDEAKGLSSEKLGEADVSRIDAAARVGYGKFAL
jgi:hypothetical protein